MKALSASLMQDLIRDSVDPDVFDGVLVLPHAWSSERPLQSELECLCCALAELAIRQYAPRRWSQRMIVAVATRLFLHLNPLTPVAFRQADRVAGSVKP